MKSVKVLGTGCANCKTTLKLIEDIAKEKGVEIQLAQTFHKRRSAEQP